MSRRRSRTQRPPKTASTCCFCGFSEDNEVEYGKLYTHKGIVTHYYCLLLSSNMEQNGKDNQGILGFLPADIQKELRRGKRLTCVYCRNIGATLGCCNSRCKRVFHLPCGLQAGSLHQFFDEFRSYCVSHRINQEIDEHIKAEAAAAGTVTCYICYEEVNPQNTIRTLWAPCCRKNAWFHRKCVQRLALSAGYFFKCPLCNNNQEFQKAMLEHGIFIPNQDASWELVPNAYQELLHRHSCCDAAECLCPKGRNHTGLNAKWELVLCRLCGSQGIHKACGLLKWANSHWECNECIDMLHKSDAPASGENRIKEISPAISDDESSNDSDISVGRNPSPLPVTQYPESLSARTPPIRIRPGPLSFKLQQAVKCVKSTQSANVATANTSQNSDILRNILSATNNDSKNEVSNETPNCEALQTTILPEKIDSLCTQSPNTQTISTVPRETSDIVDLDKEESVEPKRRSAEVILIESDDEVEIISVKSKQTVLTTMDGTTIEIHTLPQVITEQKGSVDVKVEYEQAQLLKLPSTQSQQIPAIVGTTSPKTSSSIFNSLSPTSTGAIMPPLHPLSVPGSPVTSKTSAYAGRKKLFEVEQSDPIADPVMNLKIVNITSVPIEDFVNGDSPIDSGPQRRIIQTPDANNPTLGTRTTAFHLSSAAIKDINSKRKSNEYKCAVSNSTDTVLMEQCKRARTVVSSNPPPPQNGVTYTWGMNLNESNEGIPIIAKSVTTTQPSNSNKIEQSPATMQRNSNESLISCNNGVRTIYSLEIQKRNGYKGQTKVNNNANHINTPSMKPSPIGSQENGLIQSDTVKQLPAASNINQQQFLVNTLSNSSISGLDTQQGSTQSVFANKGIALTGGTMMVHPSRDDVDVRGHSVESVNCIQTNLSEFAVYNELAKKSMQNPTCNGGTAQPDASNVFTTGQSMVQLPNGFTIPSGCDGDAGSNPAADAGATQQATISPGQLQPPPESISDIYAATGSEQRGGAYSSISTPVSAIPAKYIQRYSSIETAGEHCDKPGLIPENVPLQDLKFRVMDSEIIEIIVCNNYKLNVNANMGNPENKSDSPDSQRSEKKENLVPTDSTRQKFCPKSPEPSPIVSKYDLDNKGVLNTRTHLADDKNYLSKTRNSIGSEIFGGSARLEGSPNTQNVSKGDTVSSISRNNPWAQKPSYTRDGRILSNGKCKYLNDDMVKTVQNNTALNFCRKIDDRSIDKGEKKRSSESTCVSKCLLENLLDSSQMNLPIDCYSNYKEVDRSNELSSNIKNFDAGLRDSPMKNGTKDVDVRPKNGFSQLVADPNAEKSRQLDTLNLNECMVQSVDENTSSSVAESSGTKGSRVDNNCKGELVPPSGIKVKINLNRIQHFVNSNPELFSKSNVKRNQCTDDERVSETSESTSSFHGNGSRKRSILSNSETRRSEMKNMENSNTRKRFKYDPGLFRKHTKS